MAPLWMTVLTGPNDAQRFELQRRCPDFDPQAAIRPHTRSCYTCAHTMLDLPELYPRLLMRRLVRLDVLVAVAVPHLAPEYFSEPSSCEYCGTEVRELRMTRMPLLYLTNASDQRPHTCGEFHVFEPHDGKRVAYVSGRRRSI